MSDARKDLLNKGVEAALELAKTIDWRDLTLSAIAERAGLSLKDFHGVADKAKISDAVEAWLDDAMSEGSTNEDETPRTRLFDVIMMRFDRMEEHREAMLSLIEWRQTQPARLLNLIAARHTTASWALSCSGLDGSGDFPKPIRTTAIAWALAQAEIAWRKEDSADMSRTMAKLDGELRKMEERAGWITSRFSGRKSGTGEKPEATTGHEPTTEHQPS
ncbi:TetR/AcrR family transcriptional regulator [Henriciella marina]|uniref:TetR family transcriptional regulator n=1 Tax=Henriciella marina TaxID=453851 RepID=A0ABT4LXW8_9PROT|nr:hypothetical protein [Henriciella marina]MCZ4299210.1 hypothetical protein [Henriciella marina]